MYLRLRRKSSSVDFVAIVKWHMFGEDAVEEVKGWNTRYTLSDNNVISCLRGKDGGTDHVLLTLGHLNLASLISHKIVSVN